MAEAVLNQTWLNTIVRVFTGFGGGLEIERNGGMIQLQAPVTTGVPDTLNVFEDVIENYQSIIPLKGMFANDPAWDDLPTFLENYWREIDETVETD